MYIVTQAAAPLYVLRKGAMSDKRRNEPLLRTRYFSLPDRRYAGTQ